MTEFTLPHDHGDHKNADYLHKQLADTRQFAGVAEVFWQLADPNRVRIFWLLCQGEECVINISALLGMTSPAVSHHLRPMRDHGMIQSRREGKEVYYSIADTRECALLRRLMEQAMADSCPPPEQPELSPALVARNVHKYLLDHLDERITIENLARRFLVNPTTLKQAFKQVYGMSIAAHMNEHRMEQAARLLTETRQTVAEIAGAVGFSSQSRFSAAFKQRYGCLPTEYRKTSKSF
ncbi:MAG: metalloregulator ArsR/SmtB family transcription factor [Christensenellaceae bacterium]|nr:metalloregulator ArsR/SmtB family transcription factor [Christensenellaceae bacterium]